MEKEEHLYPLACLENSYGVITELKWHSWIIQKQKILEFQMRNREDQLKKGGGNFHKALFNYTAPFGIK